jgi:large subunit ribosomal protein L4
MIQLIVKDIFNLAADVETFDFPDTLASLNCKNSALRMVYNTDLILQYKSCSHTKDRGEVSGTTKKMYRQKGTGGARHGSARVSQFRGGGVTFGPRFAKRFVKINKKLRNLALLTCYNKHIARNTIVVLKDLYCEKAKTKETFNLLSSAFSKLRNERSVPTLELGKSRCLFADQTKINETKNFYLSSRNIVGLNLVEDKNISVLDLIKADMIFVTKVSLDAIVRRFQEKLSVNS